MNRFFKTVLVATSLATAGVATSATTASAGSGSFSITIGSGGHGGGHWGGHRGGRDRGHWGGRRHNRGYCAPRQALNKAHRMGIRHARIIRANNRVVKVAGRSRGHRVNAVFANTWRCPVVRFR